MSDYLDPNNEELLKDFYVEAELQVEGLEQNILVLENDPGNSDAVDEIFRAAHTLKGAAATVQMNELSSFTHLVEDVLDEIRSGNISINEAVIDVLLGSIDVIKAMLEARSSGGVYEEDISAIKDGLSRILERKDAPATEEKDSEIKSIPESEERDIEIPEVPDSLTEYDILELMESAEEGEYVYELKVSFNEDHPMNTVGAIQVFAALKGVGMVLKTIPDFDKLYDDIFFPDVFYYVAASESSETLQKAVYIPGAVTGVVINQLESPASVPPVSESGEEGKKKPEKAEEKPVPETPSAEEAGNRTKTTDLKKSKKGSSVLRVDSKRIDNLLNLVSETVITKATFNQIGNRFSDVQRDFSDTLKGYNELLRKLFSSFPEYLEKMNNGESLKEIKNEFFDEFGSVFTMWNNFESEFKNTIVKLHSTSQSLARTTGELQEGVMEIRMVPISQIFSRFPRLVRDASKMLNKKIKLVIEGEETELDKSVIEDLLDPLIHCVRNSVDHGIESPAERKAAGKPAEGQVLLKASNEGNMIVIDIEDDGKGIDVKSVYDKAVERGVIHPSKILSDVEAFNLIFEPGFSTAKEITDISGRGVGLDVVRKQIEKLNGNVSVWSEKEKGTKLTIKIPLTLAIIQGLLVRVGTEIYAIPITSVIDSHRIKQSDIRMIDNYEVFNVREDVVSLIRLNRLFNIKKDEDGEYHFVVVVGSGDKKMGLMVDSLIGEEDVVIKPLMDKFTNSPGIAGATILGDGMVALIIDVSQLLELGLKKEREHRQHLSASIV